LRHSQVKDYDIRKTNWAINILTVIKQVIFNVKFYYLISIIYLNISYTALGVLVKMAQVIMAQVIMTQIEK